MNDQKISERIHKILGWYSRDLDALKHGAPETRILNDLRVNSARFVDLILAVEDEFDIEIMDSETNLINTIGDLNIIVKKKLNA